MSPVFMKPSRCVYYYIHDTYSVECTNMFYQYQQTHNEGKQKLCRHMKVNAYVKIIYFIFVQRTF